MKSEINNENKAKFFALYFDQTVLENPFGQVSVNGRSLNYVLTDSMNANLNLKPLSQISDEDAKFIDLDTEDYNENGWISGGLLYYWSFDAVDYLRSKGYALPWMGLSVEDLINSGWVHLLD